MGLGLHRDIVTGERLRQGRVAQSYDVDFTTVSALPSWLEASYDTLSNGSLSVVDGFLLGEVGASPAGGSLPSRNVGVQTSFDIELSEWVEILFTVEGFMTEVSTGSDTTPALGVFFGIRDEPPAGVETTLASGMTFQQTGGSGSAYARFEAVDPTQALSDHQQAYYGFAGAHGVSTSPRNMAILLRPQADVDDYDEGTCYLLSGDQCINAFSVELLDTGPVRPRLTLVHSDVTTPQFRLRRISLELRSY
jgi:hypothetical protein